MKIKRAVEILWDALSEILEEPANEVPNALRQRGIKAIQAAEDLRDRPSGQKERKVAEGLYDALSEILEQPGTTIMSREQALAVLEKVRAGV